VLFLLAIHHGILPGIYAGFLLGLGQDLYSPVILGQTALAKTVMGAFAGLFNERVMRTDPLTKGAILFVCFIIHDAAFSLTALVKSDASLVALLPELVAKTVPRAMYSGVVTLLVYAWINLTGTSTRR
jgi:rod shape-determining protein MreD